ncbi:glycosyltransferase [Bacteroides caecimuris]|uniref:glycosyltransferase n=1 Tax=Bacteroides caecimuris TaxID=1796613 RepID=UPI00264833E7|nr:glycosyltransferase [Bacteroides caecimuris]
MNFLLINAVCGRGSTGRICADLHDMLVAKGHRAVIAYAHGKATRVPLEDTYRINGQRGYYIHNAISRFTDRAGFYSTNVTYKFIKFIEAYKPDLIHLHNLHGYYINVKVLFNYLSKKKIPVVWTLHDCWAFTGHCSHYSYSGCDKWLSECHDCQLIKDYPQSILLDRSRKNFIEKRSLFTSLQNMHITTPSNWLSSQVEKSFLKKYPVTAIYNGIDLSTFKPVKSNVREKYGIARDKYMLLAVANEWGPRKGFSDLLNLSSKLDHSKYQIVMVGLSKKNIALLPQSVIGIERTESLDELVRLYSSADIFLNPSYEETMGMVTAEALACGTPVITYNKTAVPEVADVNSGIVVSAGDVDAMLASIPVAMKLSGEACRNRAMEFELDQQYKKYYQLYLSCLIQH